MSTTNDRDVIDSVTRTSPIIAAGLITGVLVMLGVSVVLAPSFKARPGVGGAVEAGRMPDANAGPRPAPGPADLGEILTWTAVAFAAVGLPLSVVVPRWITDQNRRSIAAGTWVPPGRGDRKARGAPTPIDLEAPESDTGKLASVYSVQFIVGAALNEGQAFFASLVYLIESHPIALGLALLLLVALIVRFPTRLRIASWIDGQQELLLRDRQAAF
jgi:hypothetical protein